MSFSPTSQQSHLGISSLTPTPALDEKILLALLPLPPLLPSSSSKSSCCCSTHLASYPPTLCPLLLSEAPWLQLHLGTQTCIRYLQPCLTPEHWDQALLFLLSQGLCTYCFVVIVFVFLLQNFLGYPNGFLSHILQVLTQMSPSQWCQPPRPLCMTRKAESAGLTCGPASELAPCLAWDWDEEI